jgi:hypothetical protein
MGTIIAGRFQEQTQADAAAAALEATGFPHDRIATFFVNPPGQHDLHGTHRDPDASAGAHRAGTGAAAGAGVAAVVGLATLPVLGPGAALAGAAIGAYVGSLAGALEGMGGPEPGDRSVAARLRTDEGLPRKSGMLVAVDAASPTAQASAIEVLRTHGAIDLESAQGKISQRRWDDFDPLSTPIVVAVAR